MCVFVLLSLWKKVEVCKSPYPRGVDFSHHFVLKFHSPLNSHMYNIKESLLVKVLTIVSTIRTLHIHNWKRLSKEIYEAESHILMQNLIYENKALNDSLEYN